MHFKDWMNRNGHTLRKAEELLGISRDAVHGLQRGTRVPTLEVAAKVVARTRALNPRACVHWEDMLPAETRAAIFGEKGRP